MKKIQIQNWKVANIETIDIVSMCLFMITHTLIRFMIYYYSCDFVESIIFSFEKQAPLFEIKSLESGEFEISLTSAGFSAIVLAWPLTFLTMIPINLLINSLIIRRQKYILERLSPIFTSSPPEVSLSDVVESHVLKLSNVDVYNKMKLSFQIYHSQLLSDNFMYIDWKQFIVTPNPATILRAMSFKPRFFVSYFLPFIPEFIQENRNNKINKILD